MFSCLAGCLPQADLEASARLTRIRELEDENIRLRREVTARDKQLREQAAAIAELRGLGAERSLDDVVHVDRIEIERLSGGYDEDLDGVDDGVVVYLRLYDQYGGTMRAAGVARVRIFDPANPEERNLVAERAWSRDQLREEWSGRLLTSHFTLHVPWAKDGGGAEHHVLTAFVTFTDLLTGRTFTSQKEVRVAIGAGPAAGGPSAS